MKGFLQGICLSLSIFQLQCFATHSSTLTPPAINMGATFVETALLYPSTVNVRSQIGKCVGERTRDAISGVNTTGLSGNPYAPLFKPIQIPYTGFYLIDAQAMVCRDQQGSYKAYLQINSSSNYHQIRLGRSKANGELIGVGVNPTQLKLLTSPERIKLTAGQYIGLVIYIVPSSGNYNNEAMVFISGFMKITYVGP